MYINPPVHPWWRWDMQIFLFWELSTVPFIGFVGLVLKRPCLCSKKIWIKEDTINLPLLLPVPLYHAPNLRNSSLKSRVLISEVPHSSHWFLLDLHITAGSCSQNSTWNVSQNCRGLCILALEVHQHRQQVS